MDWTSWIVVTLTALNAGWMVFDGGRALLVGDYVTPKTGEYAGQLGPWSKLVESVGIEPRSTLMKSVFVGYGLVMLVIAVSFAMRVPGAWWALLAGAVLGLWYLPFGTAANIIVLVLLLFPAL